ncbi:protein IQ-DOMAIN 32-like [Apium graveolens]|uniref:protein IQ-DOMAIN 32-like n=1 Tax=Apium graveolens TaxID=4045 RepID=UPI003D78FE68
MGRSTASCFKIIACGKDSVDRDDLQLSQNKPSTDKRGWSFGKRSARHRVLSNTVISETPSSVSKEIPESASADYQIPATAAIPEKSSDMERTDEMLRLSASINSKFPESIAVAEVNTKLDIQPDESVVIIIQTAVRKFLAERELSKQKNIVKLQAAVRGHLVRRHAVGSLRCVQAIIKMQVLVRARRTRLPSVESTDEENLHAELEKNNSTQKEERKSGAEPDLAYTSIEKLLSNRFARQLLESSPKTKSMNIKCDPSRPDSAWKWLERWVAVSPLGTEQSPTSEPVTELKEQEVMKHPEKDVETRCPAEEGAESTDLRFRGTQAAVAYLNSDASEATVPSESEQNLVNQKFEQPQPEFLDLIKSTENSHQLLDEDKPSNSSPQIELESLSSKPDLEEQPKRSMKRVASEEPETEGRKFVFGSRKASNAAFIAVQSKFEDLTSASNSLKSVNMSNQESEVKSYEDTLSLSVDNSFKKRDTSVADCAVSSATKVLVGESECGTELSISSTLDSPDQSDIGAVDEHEADVAKEAIENPNNTTNIVFEDRVDDPIIVDTDLPVPITVQLEEQSNNEEVVTAESLKPQDRLEENSSDMQIKLESGAADQMYKSSPEASPRTRATVLESQTTPSSQVSTKSKKSRSEKYGSSQKRKSLSVGKRSPLPTNDSGVRSSLEQLPKDQKSGKRRNSFGSAKADQVDQEPRDSSSSLSVPSYMQATESARAKAYANVSPRSSPDVQDKESFIKKRHSLPGTNGRQGSPRIQRSMSQAQQSTKVNGSNSSQERKWQR